MEAPQGFYNPTLAVSPFPLSSSSQISDSNMTKSDVVYLTFGQDLKVYTCSLKDLSRLEGLVPLIHNAQDPKQPCHIAQYSYADIMIVLDMVKLESIFKYKEYFTDSNFLQNLEYLLKRLTPSLDDPVDHLIMAKIKNDLKWMPLQEAEELIRRYSQTPSEKTPEIVKMAKKCIINACYFDSWKEADGHFTNLREIFQAVTKTRIKLKMYEKKNADSRNPLLECSIASAKKEIGSKEEKHTELKKIFNERRLEERHFKQMSNYVDSDYHFVAQRARKCQMWVQSGNIPEAIIKNMLTSINREDLVGPFLKLINYYQFEFKCYGSELIFTHPDRLILSNEKEDRESRWSTFDFKYCPGPYELEDEMIERLRREFLVLNQRNRCFNEKMITYPGIPNELRGKTYEYRECFLHWIDGTKVSDDKIIEIKNLIIQINNWNQFNFTSNSFTVNQLSHRKYGEIAVYLKKPELEFQLNIFTFQARLKDLRSGKLLSVEESVNRLKMILEGREPLSKTSNIPKLFTSFDMPSTSAYLKDVSDSFFTSEETDSVKKITLLQELFPQKELSSYTKDELHLLIGFFVEKKDIRELVPNFIDNPTCIEDIDCLIRDRFASEMTESLLKLLGKEYEFGLTYKEAEDIVKAYEGVVTSKLEKKVPVLVESAYAVLKQSVLFENTWHADQYLKTYRALQLKMRRLHAIIEKKNQQLKEISLHLVQGQMIEIEMENRKDKMIQLKKELDDHLSKIDLSLPLRMIPLMHARKYCHHSIPEVAKAANEYVQLLDEKRAALHQVLKKSGADMNQDELIAYVDGRKNSLLEIYGFTLPKIIENEKYPFIHPQANTRFQYLFGNVGPWWLEKEIIDDLERAGFIKKQDSNSFHHSYYDRTPVDPKKILPNRIITKQTVLKFTEAEEKEFQTNQPISQREKARAVISRGLLCRKKIQEEHIEFLSDTLSDGRRHGVIKAPGTRPVHFYYDPKDYIPQQRNGEAIYDDVSEPREEIDSDTHYGSITTSNAAVTRALR